uniref:Zeta toxin domain-containing protein n=1 Tax=Salix viminalis TaxID=40686 RepID=A0A6N2LJ64_SALVM
MPHRATRPNHIVIILRGLPGSGKSYLAKMMRDLEVENGGNVPRIHSMDDYFMTEVEKVEDGDASKSSSSTRGKKPIVKRVVMEYCYEPEMEEAYRESLLKAFKKTLEEGTFTLVIGYEVYVSEATYKDPVGCAARNVHGFTIDEIQTMARQWEEAPLIFTQLDIKSLFCGDDLKKNGIQEVDMDTGW